MSNKIRRGHSVSKLATALCSLSILSTGSATAQDSGPKLIRTTTPIRINTDSVYGGTLTLPGPTNPADLPSPVADQNASLKHARDEDHDLRVLLNPNRNSSFDRQTQPTATGNQRTDQFVELQHDLATLKDRKVSTTRSAVVVQRVGPRSERRSRQRDQFRKHPLVVDAPPKLRRFSVHDRPLNQRSAAQNEPLGGALIARVQPTPAPPVPDLNQTLDTLSDQPGQDVGLRSAARTHGFGMLAIDQIGSDLNDSADDASTITNPPLERFATDMVLRNEDMIDTQEILRDQLRSPGTQRMIHDNVPQLPPPSRASEDLLTSGSVSQSLSAFDRRDNSTEVFPLGLANSATVRETAAGPNRPDPAAGLAREVDELLSSGLTKAGRGDRKQPEAGQPEAKVAQKPSFAERLTGWSKKLGTGRNAPPSQPVAARLDKSESNAATSAKQRSGAILPQWLRKFR